MTTHNAQTYKGFGWLGVLLAALAALAACAQMTQPTGRTQPAKAYVGLFKDNAVAVVDTKPTVCSALFRSPQVHMAWLSRATGVRST